MDLFTPPTRDERQEEGRIKWIRSKCTGTLEYGTGVGIAKITWNINCLTFILILKMFFISLYYKNYRQYE